MTKVAVSKMFNHSKIRISDETNYLKVFQHTDVGMITLRLDLENQLLKRKLRHALGISMPSVRQIEATTDALLAWMSPDELLYFCMKSEVVNRLNLLKETMTSYHSLSLDVSDARVVFSLEGGKVREVIAKLAPIDTAINTSSEIFKRIPDLPKLMDRADYALKLMADGKLNFAVGTNKNLELEQMKIKNFRNNIVISFFGVVIVFLLVF